MNDCALTASTRRTALCVDIDGPFQGILAAWLGARSCHVAFASLDSARNVGGAVDVLVCELADPKRCGPRTLQALNAMQPGAALIAISSRFVARARHEALAGLVGAHAALPKPASRQDFLTALDSAIVLARTQRPAQERVASVTPTRLACNPRLTSTFNDGVTNRRPT